VFERFSDPSRQVVVLAQDEARALQHNYIGTEHILLGLLREERGAAARVLTSLDLSIDLVRDKVRTIIGEGDEVAAGQIPFTPRAKKVLELGLREAQAMNHDSIGTEHLLLAIAREGDGVAMRILDELGAGGERIRREVNRQLGFGRQAGFSPGASPPPFPAERRVPGPSHLLTAWMLGAATLGVGILVGWAIWG